MKNQFGGSWRQRKKIKFNNKAVGLIWDEGGYSMYHRVVNICFSTSLGGWGHIEEVVVVVTCDRVPVRRNLDEVNGLIRKIERYHQVV